MSHGTLSQLKQKLHLFDPGFFNLRTALRGTFGVLTSFFILSFLARSFSQPPTVAFLGSILPMMSAMIINDPTRQQRRMTTLLLVIPALLGMLLSVALSHHTQLRIGVFFIVTFFAIVLRRFGMRWFAVGFIGFMMFFMPLFFPMHEESIPAAFVALTIGVAISYIFRFWIFPDRPKNILKNYLIAYDEKIKAVLVALEHRIQNTLSGAAPLKNPSKSKVHHRLLELNELILSIEQFLKLESNLSKVDAEVIQLRLFERELSLRDVIETVKAMIQTGNQQFELLEAARHEINIALSRINPDINRIENANEKIKKLKESLIRVSHNQLEVSALDDDELKNNEMAKPPSMTVTPGLHLTTRQAIQATLATALASLLGASVSTDRWYWASMTAFIIFAGASRADTAVRASLRIVGTILGLVLGFGLARLATGHGATELIFIMLFVFLGLFLARRAFGFWSAFLFSIMIVILFDIMGQMTFAILLLRLEETVIGAFIGAVISAVILPTSTRGTIRTAQIKFIKTLIEILEELPLEHSRRRILVTRLRQMDQDFMALKLSAAPLSDFSRVFHWGAAREVLFHSSALAHLVKHLATYPGNEDLTIDEIKDHVKVISRRLEKVIQSLESKENIQEMVQIEESPNLESHSLRLLFFRIEQVAIDLYRSRI